MSAARGPNTAYTLRIELLHTSPPVWRRVLVASDIRLDDLHQVIQIAFGWSGSHLHEFVVEGVSYGPPDPDEDDDEVEDETHYTLGGLVRAGGDLRYLYDFGDDRDHHIVVEQVADAEAGRRYPACLDGRRACPPEDVGGPWGYRTFRAALADPAHAEHARTVEWAEAFDPEVFDLEATNSALQSERRLRGP